MRLQSLGRGLALRPILANRAREVHQRPDVTPDGIYTNTTLRELAFLCLCMSAAIWNLLQYHADKFLWPGERARSLWSESRVAYGSHGDADDC